MTPRNPWRRTWRDKVIPILWLMVAAVIIGGAAGIKSAHAAPASPGQQFADEHGADICVVLDAHPTPGGVLDVMDTLQSDGLSPLESGVAVVESVMYVCPIHADLLRKIAARGQERRRIA